MSQENVELVRRAWEALGTGDLDAGLALVHPDAEVYTRPEGTFGLPASYRGHAELRQFRRDIDEMFIDFRMEPTELIDGGDYVVIGYRQSALVQGFESRVESHPFCVCLVRDGKVAEGRVYSTRGEAVAAAGSEE